MPVTAKPYNDRKILTGLVRIGFAYVFEPKINKKKPEADPKYTCMVVFEKGSDTEKVLKDCMREVAKAKWGEKLPGGWHGGLRDGDNDKSLDPESDDPYMKERIANLKGMRFLNASTKKAPRLLGRKGTDGKRVPLEPGELKSGDYVQMAINCFAFEEDGNKAVGFGFDTIVFKQKGEPCFGGGGGTTDEGAFDDDDDDDDEDEF